MLKDSGQRESFDTGAVRDTQDDKPRPDLISPYFLLRLGRWLGLGAKKYDERNWEKGISNSRCMASLKRHLAGYERGLTDEDHLAAVAFNVMAMVHNEEMVKLKLLPDSLMDLPWYENDGKMPIPAGLEPDFTTAVKRGFSEESKPKSERNARPNNLERLNRLERIRRDGYEWVRPVEFDYSTPPLSPANRKELFNEGFVYTGECRLPKLGEWYYSPEFGPLKAYRIHKYYEPPKHILQPIPILWPKGYFWTGEYRGPKVGEMYAARGNSQTAVKRGSAEEDNWSREPRFILQSKKVLIEKGFEYQETRYAQPCEYCYTDSPLRVDMYLHGTSHRPEAIVRPIT